MASLDKTDHAAVLAIPDALKPRDGRFGSGPSKIRAEQLERLLDPSTGILGTSHRQPPVRRVVRDIRTGLRDLFDLPDGYEIVLGNGGAGAFWDVATACLIENRVAHQVCGEFSQRFADATGAAPFLQPSIVDRAQPGRRPEPLAHAEADAYAWAQNETSTGVVSPVSRPLGAAAAEQLTIVDAVSSAGAIETDLSQADAYYFSPQKVFSAEGGIWFAALSPMAIERAHHIVERRDRWIPPFLSLTDAIANSRKDQSYNTPALSGLVLMAEQIRWLNGNGGLSWAAGRSHSSSTAIYEWADAHPDLTPFVRDPEHRSPVTCVIDVADAVDATVLASVLRRNGILDIEPYRTIGTQQLRIATFPSIEPGDVSALLDCVDWVLERLPRS